MKAAFQQAYEKVRREHNNHARRLEVEKRQFIQNASSEAYNDLVAQLERINVNDNAHFAHYKAEKDILRFTTHVWYTNWQAGWGGDKSETYEEIGENTCLNFAFSGCNCDYKMGKYGFEINLTYKD